MKLTLKNPIWNVNDNNYIIIIIFLAPILNFLSGLDIDIYSPSMPAIANYFHATIQATKNTITFNIIGLTCGAILWGILIDIVGRKRILLFSLCLYLIATLSSNYSHTINQFAILRFIQGFSISAMVVGSRALVVDNIIDHRYALAIVYTSIGYSLGPMLGPFIGCMLQYYIGWNASFVLLVLCSGFLILIMFAFLKENKNIFHPRDTKNIFSIFIDMLQHKQFMSGVFICSLIQIQIMIYPTMGPFIIENILHQSAITYGNSASLIAASYFFGTLCNIFGLKITTPRNMCYLGYAVFLLALITCYCFSIFFSLHLATLAIPLSLVCISGGIISTNILGDNLKHFPKRVGVAMAIQTPMLLLVTSLGIASLCHIHLSSLSSLFVILSILGLLQMVLFLFGYTYIFQKRQHQPLK